MEERFLKRIEKLRETKFAQTARKVEKFGRTLNGDDKGLILYDGEFNFNLEAGPNHANGGSYGAAACGRNYRRLLETHPVYIDPQSSLAGGWMFSIVNYCWKGWPEEELDYSFLHEEHERYGGVTGIGATQHFLADVRIGLELGWGGILDKIRFYRALRSGEEEAQIYYDALEDCIFGIQNIILHHAAEAETMAGDEADLEIKSDLLRMAEANRRLATEPPVSFYDAVQWTTWFVIVLDIYNGAGAALGAIDTFLYAYYRRDRELGILSDDEAMFHIACLLFKDVHYCQIGGMWADGSDRTNELSFLILEATHLIKIPSNLCLRVHEKLNPELMRRAVTYLFEDRKSTPSFLGDPAMHEGFMRNGFPRALAATRERCGCHWVSLPGREYSIQDCVKLHFAKIFDIALREMMADQSVKPGTQELMKRYKQHIEKAVWMLARGFDFHLDNMWKVLPELPMSLLCYGPIEKGMDASRGGVLEYNNICVDGAGLATVADSFAALEQRIEIEGRITWEQLMHYLDTDYQDAEDVRLMLRSTPRYGSGGSLADSYAVKLTNLFAKAVKARPTPKGYWMVPGLFSWANDFDLGKTVGATPDGRHAGQAISHGANPTPGFKEAGALTAMAEAVASVQCRYGNTTPIQLEIDPLLGKDEGGIENMISFINAYCLDMKGTLMNINILDKDAILDANEHPERYPDLVVRVTGFSAYFALLDNRFRQMVVDRIIAG